jgi:hypothetical protein
VTKLLVEKRLLAGRTTGTMKHQWEDEHAGFQSETLSCTKQ